MLSASALPDRIRRDALAVFTRLADAEGHVHGIDAQDVHFHEVGALDSLADVIGVCAALHQLGIDHDQCQPSSRRLRSGQGGPWTYPGTRARGDSTGQGVADPCGRRRRTHHTHRNGAGHRHSPAVRRSYRRWSPRLGSGAGTKDTPGRPNITRVIIGEPTSRHHDPVSTAVVLEANVDDLDPRLWPGVLTRLLSDGASDAWLTPILMKKGRPAHTLNVLCQPDLADGLRQVIYAETTTLGIRQHTVRKHAALRGFAEIDRERRHCRDQTGAP